MAAARWCFLHFGYEKTSLEDIAKRAAISRPLLYLTFKNKEQIFGAVFEEVFAHFGGPQDPLSCITPIADGKPKIEAVRARHARMYQYLRRWINSELRGEA